jgi:hypothetical protein
MRSILTLLLLTVATPALAVDGVLEINQTCAVQTGCFTGDTAGFPVTITATGSYRLTGNLFTIDAADTAILITADQVTLDLNGFALACGIGICPAGFTAGFGVDATGRLGLHLRNGSIFSFTSSAVVAGDRARIEDLRVSGLGFIVPSDGIAIGDHGSVRGNTVVSTGGDGISVGVGGLVSENTSSANAGAGIRAGGGGTLRGNTARGNTGVGLALAADDGYGGNVLTGNNGGAVSGGLEIGSNLCGNDTICP